MTEEPQSPPTTDAETVAACRNAHNNVCQALKALQPPAGEDTGIEIDHALRWLGAAAAALSRHIQAHAPGQADPVRETEPTPNPEPEGQLPPEPVLEDTGDADDTEPDRDPDPDGDAAGEAVASQST